MELILAIRILVNKQTIVLLVLTVCIAPVQYDDGRLEEFYFL